VSDVVTAPVGCAEAEAAKTQSAATTTMFLTAAERCIN
jgi:hypothetical protein